jgi:hypothetical protein
MTHLCTTKNPMPSALRDQIYGELHPLPVKLKRDPFDLCVAAYIAVIGSAAIAHHFGLFAWLVS